MKVNQLKMGVFFSYASQAVSILSALLYTPVMLRILGQSEYGLYQMVYSVISYLGLLSLGFGSGYIRFYSIYKAKGEEKNIARLNGMYLLVFIIISAISLICGAVIIFNIKAVFGAGLTVSELGTAKILFCLMLISLATNLVRSVFLNNISANEKFLFHRGISFVHLLLEPFITLPILLMGFGSVGMVTVSTGFSLVMFFSSVWYCFKYLNMKFLFNKFEPGLLKEIFVFTFFIFISIIVDRINWSVDKFLLGRMIGTVSVAIYSVSSQMNLLYVNFSTAISCMFIPRINRFVSEEDDSSKLSALFIRVGRLQFLILALIVSGFTFFGREFIEVWAGPEYAGSYYVGLLLMIPGTVPLIQNLGVEIQKAKNMHRVCAVVNLAIAIGNIFLSIPLIQKYSYIGAATGTAISIIGGNIFINWYYHKKMGIDILRFWKEILKFIPALTVSAVLALLLNKFLPPSPGFIPLARNIIIYSLIYGAVFWLMGMNKSEKNLIIVPLKAVINKFKR